MAAVREQRARSVDGVRNMDHLRSYWRCALHRCDSIAVCRHWIGGWSIDDLKSPEHQALYLGLLTNYFALHICALITEKNGSRIIFPNLNILNKYNINK